MNIKNLFNAFALASLMMGALNANAGNINVTTARAAASNFLKQHAAAKPGSFKAPAMADLKLAYAEPSKASEDARAYYAFNIDGGGFIIIAGEDRASQVLGYNDRGRLDYNNLPDGFKALMKGYKEEIEYLQTHPEYKVTPAMRATGGAEVAPLIKTYWGQEMPYYLQCPVYQGEYCVVGCVATAMAQVMYYWRYPATSPAVSSYYCYDIGQTLPALPETTFNYNLMLPSYCHWDWDNSELIQDTYTDEQAQEVAKLSRYCGQAVDMGYSPEGSGAYVFAQLGAMQDFGYSDDAQDVTRSGWWGTPYYSTEEWEAMVKEELDQRHPILYSATDPAEGGHAFICDGYNAEGLLHFNFGWYGTCDGWYVSTALNMTHRSGDYLQFNSSHEMLLGVVPPNYCVIQADALTSPGELLVLGETLDVEASNVTVFSNAQDVNLIFTINDLTGRRLAMSEAVNVTPEFEQGSTVAGGIVLPTELPTGTYNVQFQYYIGFSARLTNLIQCESSQLHVLGHLAKYGAPFTIDDVTVAMDSLLERTSPVLTIDDITGLIDLLLSRK